MKQQAICTRCSRLVPETDVDARFKHGEIIACGECSKPTPQHRYHRNCQCKPCLRVRAVLMQK